MSASKKASYVTFVSVLRCYDSTWCFFFRNTRLALMWPFWRGEHPVFWFYIHSSSTPRPNTTKPAFFRDMDAVAVGVFASGRAYSTTPLANAHSHPPERLAHVTFVCPCVLLPLSCPCRVVYLRRKESGREDRHTSLALHSIKLKNFGPFRDEVLSGVAYLFKPISCS